MGFYVSVCLDDHSRVKLRALAGKDAKHSDYINANYVDVRPSALLRTPGLLISEMCMKMKHPAAESHCLQSE